MGIIASCVYIYPVFQGLILLPLDLLVSNSAPWLYASTILLKNPFMVDSITQMYPWHRMTYESLTRGVLPLWNSYQLMGMPFMASMKPMVFYPANILFIFGEIISWNGLLWLQLFMSFWFFYLLMKSFNLRIMSSLFGSVSYAFSTLMIGVLQFGSEGHVLLWLPFLLLMMKRYIETSKKLYLVGFSFAVACAVFAGHLQYLAYELLLVSAFTWFLSRNEKNKTAYIFTVGIFLILGIGVSAIQLLPGLEMFANSYRGLSDSSVMFTRGLQGVYQFLRLWSPDWFGHPLTRDLHGGYIEMAGYFGIIPLFFSLYAGFLFKKQSSVRFFLITALFALAFSLNGIAQILSVLHVPIITSGYGGRIFSLFLFSASVLASFGLDYFIQEKNKTNAIRFLSIFVIISIGIYTLGILGGKYNAIFGTKFIHIKFPIMILIGLTVLMVLQWRFQKYRLIQIGVIVSIFALTYLDLFRMGYRFLTFSNPKFLYPDIPVVSFVREATEKTLDRTYGLTEAEIYTTLRVFSAETYNPLYPKKTALLLSAIEGKDTKMLLDNKYFLIQQERLKYISDLFGIRYIATERDKNPASEYWKQNAFEKDLRRIYKDERNEVFENTTAYPRFGVYYRILDGMVDDIAISKIANQEVDLRSTLIISEKLITQVFEGSGSAVLLKQTMNSLLFEINSSSDGLFYLSDTYFPGWIAKVNGKRTPIYHANVAFRAVPIKAGRSTVEFQYQPASFRIGMVITIISIVALIGYSIFSLGIGIRNNEKQS